jgi:hypothetical protein
MHKDLTHVIVFSDLIYILYDGREDYNRKKGRRGRAAGFENLEGIKLSVLRKILLKAEVVKRQQ